MKVRRGWETFTVYNGTMGEVLNERTGLCRWYIPHIPAIVIEEITPKKWIRDGRNYD